MGKDMSSTSRKHMPYLLDGILMSSCATISRLYRQPRRIKSYQRGNAGRRRPRWLISVSSGRKGGRMGVRTDITATQVLVSIIVKAV